MSTITLTRINLEKIVPLLDKLDSKTNSMSGYKANNISGWFDTLLKTGSVEVGWRACCGTTHVTAKVRREWIAFVRKAEKLGIRTTVESVKHKNAYATSNEGFWNSEIFRLIES